MSSDSQIVAPPDRVILSHADGTLVKVYDVNFSMLVNSIAANEAVNDPFHQQFISVFEVNQVNSFQDDKPNLPYFTFSGYNELSKIEQIKLHLDNDLESPNLFVNRLNCSPDFQLTALCDSGSETNVISQSVLKGMKCVALSPCDDSIQLRGFNNQLTCPVGTIVLYLRANLRSPIPITFLVLPENIGGDKTIIGYPDMIRLGINLTFDSYSEADFRLDLNPHTPRWYTLNPETQHVQSDVDLIMAYISDSLNMNRIVKEKNEPCNHPQSVYHIKPRLKTDFVQNLSSFPKKYSPEAQKIVDDGVEDLIRRKVLVPSDISRGKALINFVLVRREGRDVRLCVDTVNFNKGIHQVTTELTSADQLFNRLKRRGFKYISALDVSKAYFCLAIAEEDVGMLYVKHKGQIFGLSRCPMGIADLPRFYNRIMYDIFFDLIQEEKILVYFDDILILSETVEDHCSLVDEVIKRLNKFNFPLNVDKCKFGFKKLKYLGMIIDNEEMAPDPEKVMGIIETEDPKTYTELMSLLGLTNYIRRFIPYSSELTSDLYSIASNFMKVKNKAFPNDVQIQVTVKSRKLKKELDNIIRLAHPPKELSNVRFVVHTDASDIGYGGVLSYVEADGTVVPMSTYRKKFNNYEANYTIPKKELLAVIACVRHWEEFLIHQQFTLYTDHIALTYLLNSDVVDHRTVKGWLCDLSRFNYIIKHVNGVDNQLSDFLSRQGCLDNRDQLNVQHKMVNSIDFSRQVDFNTVNSDTMLMEFLSNHEKELKCTYGKEYEVNILTRSGRSSNNMSDQDASIPTDNVQRLLDTLGNEHDTAASATATPVVHQFEGDVNHMGDEDVPTEQSSQVMGVSNTFDNIDEDIENDNMFVRSLKGDKVDIFHYPNAVRKKAASNFFSTPSESDKALLLLKAHDCDHGSVGSMVRRILNEGFYWPNMHKDAQLSRNACTICDHWNKIHQYAFLSSKTINAHFPWEWIQIDLSGPKKRTSKGNEYILVIIDVFTSMVLLRPLKSKDAKEVGEALLKVFADHGFPKIIQSDNGSEFDNKIISDIVEKAAIEKRFSSAYKPPTNGLVERAVGSMSQLLNKLCMQYASNEWDDLLLSVQLALNTRVNEKTGQSPFFSYYFRNSGNQGVLGYDNSFAVPDLLEEWYNSEDFIKMRNEYLEEIARCKYEAGEKQKTYLDSIRHIEPKAAVGNHVFVKNVRTDKSLPLWDGPYIVIGHDEHDNHIVKQLKGGRGAIVLDRVFPREQIKVLGYRSTSSVEDTRFIEAVLDERESQDPFAAVGETQYLVKFRGYDDVKDRRWLNEVDFDDPTIILNYKATLKRRAQKGNSNPVVKKRAVRKGRRGL